MSRYLENLIIFGKSAIPLRRCKGKYRRITKTYKKQGNHESSFFEKLMTYSGLVSGYIWSKKARKKDN